MKRIIAAADAEKDTRFEDGYDALDDDFQYLLEGLEKLDRDNSTLEALEIIEEVSRSVNAAIAKVGDLLKPGKTSEE